MNIQTKNMPPQTALIIANGTLPGIAIIKTLTASADLIVCADGGANRAKELQVRPDLIVGDFDSVSGDTLEFFHSVRQLRIMDQNTTDLEKSIFYCIENEITRADVIGASGDRIDHTTAGLGCFKKFGNRIELRLIDSAGILILIHKIIHLPTNPGERISLIPLDRCTGVRTTNLKYPLENETLELGIREGVSNTATNGNIIVSVEDGTLLLYRFHEGGDR